MLAANHLGRPHTLRDQGSALAEIQPGEDGKEYWRPSYRFHWLKHVAGSIEEAYNHFG